jgi:DNA-binding beta-propeller fold protein YncE
MFDPVGGRWYSTTSSGIYWADPGEGALQWQGPLVPGRLHHIELAPELGLAFYGTPDDVRMIELKTGATPKVLFQSRKVGSKAYDPLSKRLYLTEALSSRVLVFSIPGGERLPDIEVPGWTAHSLEASVGRIFLQAEGKSGLYVIDTRTHTVSEWPVEGPLTTPAHVEADPSGRFLFATYDRYVVAIDIATARGHRVGSRRATPTGELQKRRRAAACATAGVPHRGRHGDAGTGTRKSCCRCNRT